MYWPFANKHSIAATLRRPPLQDERNLDLRQHAMLKKLRSPLIDLFSRQCGQPLHYAIDPAGNQIVKGAKELHPGRQNQNRFSAYQCIQ